MLDEAPRPEAARPDRSESSGERLARRVNQLRRERHWSLEKLALACGVSRSMLSQIERMEASPTLAVTSAIADGFGLSLGELIDEPGAKPLLHVTRANDQKSMLRHDAACAIRALTPLRFEGDLELYELKLEPGQELRSGAHKPGTREIVFVTAGSVGVEAGNESVLLASGDCVSYRADIAHAISNRGAIGCSVLLVDAYD